MATILSKSLYTDGAKQIDKYVKNKSQNISMQNQQELSFVKLHNDEVTIA